MKPASEFGDFGLIRRPRPALVLILAVLLLAVLQGCSVSPWENNYTPTAEAAPVAKGTPVQLREVSWARLQSGLKQMESEQAKSDIHPSDWPPEKKAEAKARMLRILQVSEDPATVEILGRSTFRTTTPLKPETDADLAEFARKIGAGKVVWSRRLMGKAEEIVQEPVTTFGTAYYDRGFRRHGTATYTETYTTWVPIAVQSDEYAYVAYFLRTQM
jgi:hypothetical protein